MSYLCQVPILWLDQGNTDVRVDLVVDAVADEIIVGAAVSGVGLAGALLEALGDAEVGQPALGGPGCGISTGLGNDRITEELTGTCTSRAGQLQKQK